MSRSTSGRGAVDTEDRSGPPIRLAEVGFNQADDTSCAFIGFVFDGHAPPHRVSYERPPFLDCGSQREVDVSAWDASAYLLFRSGRSVLQSPFRSGTDFDPSEHGRGILRHVRKLCSSDEQLEWVIALDERRTFAVSVREIERDVHGVYIEIPEA